MFLKVSLNICESDNGYLIGVREPISTKKIQSWMNLPRMTRGYLLKSLPYSMAASNG